ncbi:10362_t:CDS:2 [Dentiscutata erythropus]|uniref:10362_t:CDS:1 n=1 Tax=Dentiscutata erythropus TaxID=1348616 RepID=A0A9N8ZM83_9GLOM|nr:10362_t:CDS:2 [Dentiscutata erythropus]
MSGCPQTLDSSNIDLINAAFTAVMGAHKFISEKEFQDRKARGKTNDATYKQIDLHSFHQINLVGSNKNAVVKNMNTDFMTHKYIALECTKLIISYFSMSALDPPYDYDFTYIKDIVTFMRGDIQYKRLCGWKRFALKVSRKYDYGNDKWFGTDKDAWPVSYHGTAKHNSKSITEGGYDLSRLNPVSLRRIPVGNGEYWVSEKGEDVRPYGICIKRK